MRGVALSRIPAAVWRRLLAGPARRSLRRGDGSIEAVLVVRNRFDHRIHNALASLRAQTWPQEKLRLTVVDYGSEERYLPELEALCRQFGAGHYRVPGPIEWCKSHGLNLAIRRSRSTWLLSTDVDILFAPDYLEKAVRRLREDSFRVVVAPMLDLPEGLVGEVDPVEGSRFARDRYEGRNYLPVAIPFAMTCFYRWIRGYDEFFKLWGKEDDDLIRRFAAIGVRRYLTADSFHLHQWHPKFEGLQGLDHETVLKDNQLYFRKMTTIRRNDEAWGSLP